MLSLWSRAFPSFYCEENFLIVFFFNPYSEYMYLEFASLSWNILFGSISQNLIPSETHAVNLYSLNFTMIKLSNVLIHKRRKNIYVNIYKTCTHVHSLLHIYTKVHMHINIGYIKIIIQSDYLIQMEL